MTNDVAVFLDLDNIIISARELNIPFDIQLILKHLETLTNGRIVLRRAYGDWRQNSGVPEALAAAGFELRSVVRMNGWSKNLADMQMVVDALETLIDGHAFTTYALLTGDRDFTPLVQTLRKRGKRVIGLGFQEMASRSLVQLCDDYVYYGKLVGVSANGNRNKRTRKPEKPAPPVSENGAEEPSLAVQYTRALRKQGLRVIPAGARMLILKELVEELAGGEPLEWGLVVRNIFGRYREDNVRRQSKNAINSMLIVAKRAQVIEVGRAKTLSAAHLSLAISGARPFQEAILRCDALYLQGIAELDLPFDLEQAAIALYDSPNHTRYLKIVHSRYAGTNGSGPRDAG
jgi:uncharacterized LabA/DUF88 family protein